MVNQYVLGIYRNRIFQFVKKNYISFTTYINYCIHEMEVWLYIKISIFHYKAIIQLPQAWQYKIQSFPQHIS